MRLPFLTGVATAHTSLHSTAIWCGATHPSPSFGLSLTPPLAPPSSPYTSAMHSQWMSCNNANHLIHTSLVMSSYTCHWSCHLAHMSLVMSYTRHWPCHLTHITGHVSDMSLVMSCHTYTSLDMSYKHTSHSHHQRKQHAVHPHTIPTLQVSQCL